MEIPLDDGGTIEIYDFGANVLVMGAGKAEGQLAYSTAEIRRRIRSNGLVALHRELRPDRSVPQALERIEQRFRDEVASPAAPEVALRPASARRQSRASGGTPRAASARAWCGNGCCDFNWLNANICAPRPADWSWLLLDYLDTYAFQDDASQYYGAACASSGASTYRITKEGGGGGTWTIPQGTYRWWDWLASSGSFKRDIHGSVNIPGPMAWHSFCGAAGD